MSEQTTAPSECAKELARFFYGYHHGDGSGSGEALKYWDGAGHLLTGNQWLVRHADELLRTHVAAEVAKARVCPISGVPGSCSAGTCIECEVAKRTAEYQSVTKLAEKYLQQLETSRDVLARLCDREGAAKERANDHLTALRARVALADAVAKELYDMREFVIDRGYSDETTDGIIDADAALAAWNAGKETK